MNTKNLCVTAVLAAVCSLATAQNEWYKNVKLGGYVISEYKYATQEDLTPKDNFSIRLVRLAIDGKINNDFNYRVQAQLNGTPGSTSGPRIVDAFVEWQKFGYAKIKVGQFKRAFSFENPMHPIDQGFISYAQAISKLAGFSDRVGEQASNGRDIGIQLQGDLLKAADGHNWLHYQVGIYNGQGTNSNDVNNSKDLIGGLWIVPTEGLRIGAFGWNGSYARKGTVDGQSKVVSVNRNRYAISGEYKKDDWTLRSEYIHSQGAAFSSSSASDISIKGNGDKADGWYAALIAPIEKNVCHVKARYDVYRDRADWSSSKNQYELGVDYIFLKKVKAQVNYVWVNDRTEAQGKQNYHMIDCQVSVRF